MLWRAFIIGIGAVIAQAAHAPAPSQFYIVSVSFSDFGLALSYGMVEVKPDGADSVVRYSRIATVNPYCPRMIVQSAEARLRNTAPAKVIGTSNPCSVRTSALQSALKKPAHAAVVLESVRFGIVAQCGSSSVSLSLPIEQEVDMISCTGRIRKWPGCGSCLRRSPIRHLGRGTSFAKTPAPRTSFCREAELRWRLS